MSRASQYMAFCNKNFVSDEDINSMSHINITHNDWEQRKKKRHKIMKHIGWIAKHKPEYLEEVISKYAVSKKDHEDHRRKFDR